MTTIRTGAAMAGAAMAGPAAPAGVTEEAMEGATEGIEAPEVAAAAEEGVVEAAEADIPGT